MTRTNIQILSLIITLIRYKKNGALKVEHAYLSCQKFGYKNPKTFKNLIARALELGWLYENNGYYRTEKLSKILKNFTEETKINFFKHNILKKGGSHDLREVIKEIETYIVLDNVCASQEHKILKKQRQLEVLHIAQEWIKGKKRFVTDPSLYKAVRKAALTFRNEENIAQEIKRLKDSLFLNVVTSVRSVSKLIGKSFKRSSEILNNLPGYRRKIHSTYVKGYNWFLYEELKEKFPKAVIIPQESQNRMKVCFGSLMLPEQTQTVFEPISTGILQSIPVTYVRGGKSNFKRKPTAEVGISF